MKGGTRLSSAVFQLTPTRTRCELIIIARDKKEKIASGLINPFLVQLKTAKDQFAKGGYSILLQPEHESDAAWFTKATLERFVRFVSTPEILERVCTVETEILHIEEAILIQSSNDRRHSRNDFPNNTGENLHDKPVGVNAGSCGDKSVSNSDEKAIVLYTPGPLMPETNGSYHHDEDPKLKLLKVLGTRKGMLQKEQGMAFARAVAAGFELDDIAPLVSFAKCFGAVRLNEACSRFVELWKSKHETGEWLDIQPSEALSNQPDFSSMNTSGIVLSDTLLNHSDSNLTHGISGPNKAGDNVIPNGQQEFYQARFPQLAYPTWPVHDGQPAFQGYPVQGVPLYQPYASSHFFQPNPHHVEPFASNFSPSEIGRHSYDNRDGNSAVKTGEIKSDAPPQNQAAVSRKKKSGTVVIRNINYISSKQRSSGSETNDSGSDSDSDSGSDAIHRVQSSSGAGGSNEKSVSDDRQWQAFQDCLLRNSDDDFISEKDVKLKRRCVAATDDSLTHVTRNSVGIRDGRTRDTFGYNESTSARPLGSGDEAFLCVSGGEFLSRNDEDSESNRTRLTPHEDLTLDGHRNHENIRNSYDPHYGNSFHGFPNKKDGCCSTGVPDELLVPFRLMPSVSDGEANRTAIDVHSEIQLKETDKQDSKVSYEPNDLSWMLERGAANRSSEHNPALDYEMQVCAEGKSNNNINGSEKDRKSKGSSDWSHKQRTGGPTRKGKIMKVSPPEDARARAEKLRSYKADLKKMKKEKEEAEKKRLESLKLERQKRISARGSSSSSIKPSPILPPVKQLPSKLSPASSRGSKFSDLEPDSSSPLQRSKIRTSLRYSDSNKVLKSSKLSDGSHASADRLAKSVSSLPEAKREEDTTTPDSKTSWIRRLSEPKTVSNPNPMSTSSKARNGGVGFARKLLKGPDKSKVSAIISLDKSKGETLPELKIKGSKLPLNSGDEDSHETNADGSCIVEKTVVVLEDENPSFPSRRMPEIVAETSVVQGSAKEDTPVENVHQAIPEAVPRPKESAKEAPSSLTEQKMDHHHKATTEDKVSVKESPKGLRRLLKFGKKHHVSFTADRSLDSQCSNCEPKDTKKTIEGHTLKNLISEEDNSTSVNVPPRKSTRNFSLLSPFRAKTRGKKQME